MRQIILSSLEESIDVKRQVSANLIEPIGTAAQIMIDALQRGHKVLLFGNGGSAADAQHIAAELAGRFEMDRAALPAVALTTDTSALTAISNDYGITAIFARQVEALASTGDVVVAISTSGNSPNVLEGVKAAKARGVNTIGLTGKGGGDLAQMVDLALVVPSDRTARIQEAHITIGHILCELIEQHFFGDERETS